MRKSLGLGDHVLGARPRVVQAKSHLLTHLPTARCAGSTTMLFHALLALLFSSVAANTDRGIIKLDNRRAAHRPPLLALRPTTRDAPVS